MIHAVSLRPFASLRVEISWGGSRELARPDAPRGIRSVCGTRHEGTAREDAVQDAAFIDSASIPRIFQKKGPSNLLICCRIVQERKVYLLIDMLTRGNSISSETPSSHHPLLSSLSWTLSALPSSPRHGAQHLRRLEQEAQKRCYSSLLRRVQAVSLLHRSTFSLSLIDFSLASSCAVTGIFPAAPVSSAGVVRSVRTVRHPLLLPLLPRRNRTRGF